jgi:hypothetical protein
MVTGLTAIMGTRKRRLGLGQRIRQGPPGEVPKMSLKAGFASRILLCDKLGRDAVTRRVSFPGMIF